MSVFIWTITIAAILFIIWILMVVFYDTPEDKAYKAECDKFDELYRRLDEAITVEERQAIRGQIDAATKLARWA
jgi:hypothetical protein